MARTVRFQDFNRSPRICGSGCGPPRTLRPPSRTSSALCGRECRSWKPSCWSSSAPWLRARRSSLRGLKPRPHSGSTPRLSWQILGARLISAQLSCYSRSSHWQARRSFHPGKKCQPRRWKALRSSTCPTSSGAAATARSWHLCRRSWKRMPLCGRTAHQLMTRLRDVISQLESPSTPARLRLMPPSPSQQQSARMTVTRSRRCCCC
mmetsp:Transcript_92017/g.166146  ORF Transcript_92017/g.166146 Transcript_92017/m.166146 type:complete len:207 (-) Transcript_92017:681-1301(-)